MPIAGCYVSNNKTVKQRPSFPLLSITVPVRWKHLLRCQCHATRLLSFYSMFYCALCVTVKSITVEVTIVKSPSLTLSLSHCRNHYHLDQRTNTGIVYVRLYIKPYYKFFCVILFITPDVSPILASPGVYLYL